MRSSSEHKRAVNFPENFWEEQFKIKVLLLNTVSSMSERKMFLIVFEMFGTFYFPKSLVALKKIMQGYLYHSVLQRATHEFL